MKKISVLSALTFIAVLAALLFLSSATPSANAQPQTPPDYASQGLVYEGLAGNDPECKGQFKVKKQANGKTLCTHGPDSTPSGFDAKKKVAPVVMTEAKPSSSTPATSPTTTPSSSILCDGDGTSGNRVQVLYAHASDVADSYPTYAASFKSWTIGIDTIYNTSAAQTGGARHVRFVHDANCNPIILNVTLSAAGDDSFLNTINELEAMGYSRNDRKYVIFMDARVYCGIATMSYDDTPGATNSNNMGDTFGRIDAGCWSDVIPAHELMHQIGGVQLSAPHSSRESHCYDGYDLMCRPTNGTALQVACATSVQASLFDCGHDDYYNTNAAGGSYLSTHWNASNSAFLILPSTSGGTKPIRR